MSEIDRIQGFIRDSIKRLGASGAIVGISGGIDSAVSAALCVKALGERNVLGVMLPERDTPKEALSDASLICDFLKIECLVRPITRTLRRLGVYRLQPPAELFPRGVRERYVKKRWEKYRNDDDPFILDLLNKGDAKLRKGFAFYRAKNRVRMCKLYLEAEVRGFAVAGATNKTEHYTGLYVKWGDEAVDIEPLLHLFKNEVVCIAEELNIPKKIIKKAPSGDLIPGMTDRDIFNMGYDELDDVLEQIEKGTDPDREPYRRIKTIVSAARNRRRRVLSLLEKSAE